MDSNVVKSIDFELKRNPELKERVVYLIEENLFSMTL